MRILIMILLVLSTVLPAQKIGEVPRVEPNRKAERGVALEWTSPEGRAYWYRLPKKSPKPNLIIMLHGTGLNHGWSFWNYGVADGHFRPDDIVVSPDGLTPGGQTFNFVQGDKDGDQIAGLIRLFRSRFDVNRVFLYGHSQGAFFCYWFGGRHPQLIDGYVAHAGNLLQADHPAEAKSKLGIAILHGRADAVVPVICATDTEKRLKDLGYQKVRLEIVDGLTEQSGHWPLPQQVKELMKWLDRVSVDDAATLLGLAETDLGGKDPDLETLVRNLAKLPKLVRKAPKNQRESLSGRAQQLESRIESVVSAHLASLSQMGADPKAKVHAPWAARVRRFQRAFKDHPLWKKSGKAWTKRVRSDTKKLARAAKSLSNPRAKSIKSAVDATKKHWTGDGFESLISTLETLMARDIKGLSEVEKTRFLEFVAALRKAEEEDLKAALELTIKAASL